MELQGLLVDKDKSLRPPLVLEGTKYLPALEGRQWETDDLAKSLTPAQRLDIKRTKIDVKIIKRESSPRAKYDLFQRLNSFGTIATAQEMRNPLILSASPDFFALLEALAIYPAFRSCCPISERLLDEKYDLELVLRWLILHDRPASRLTQQALRDFPTVLDDDSITLAEGYPASMNKAEANFKATFDYIDTHGGEYVFKRWDSQKGEFRGSFLNTAFEVFGCGLGYHVAENSPFKPDLLAVARDFWQSLPSGFATGRSTEARLAEFIPLGRQLLAA
jgi:hypothetical protein